MRSSLGFLVASLFCSSLLVPASALAGEKEAPPQADDPTAGLKGFELMLRPSFGGAPSTSPVRFEPQQGAQVVGDPGAILKGASPYGPGFVGQATVGYRFLPYLSAGLRGGIRTTSASDVNDGSSNLSRKSWDAGFYVRGYPLAGMESISKYVDPWVGVGIGYMRDTQSFQKNLPVQGGGSVAADVTLDHHAIAIPLAIGVDYRVMKFLSVGPSFEYTLTSAIAGCLKTAALGSESSYCSNESPGDKFIKAESYGVWTAGLDAKVTF